ncbi:MAG: LytR/AlgR family response regulator transcription factor [Rhodothermaceae bacterium]
MNQNKIKIIVVDDEKLARDIVKKHIEAFGNLEFAGECSNGFEALKMINEAKPDIVFLDIQMPKINGFEMLELLEDPPVIIFSTAYDQYALKAFEVNATDYILKPFNPQRFNEAMEKAFAALKNKERFNENVAKLVEHNYNETETLSRIVVKKGQKINIIPVENVNYLEAQDDYVMIHTTEGKFLKQKTMKYFETHLPAESFVRIHRSYILNINFMKQIELFEKESHKVILKNDTRLPVSKNGYSKLKEIITQ